MNPKEISNPTETDLPSETPQISPAQSAALEEYRILAEQLEEYFRIDRERSQKLEALCHQLLGQIFRN